MSYRIYHGTLPACDLKEYADTGVILTEFSLNPRTKWREKEGHIAAVTTEGSEMEIQPNMIAQVQGFRQAMDLEAKMEVVPTAAGARTGLANVTPGDAITLANFAATANIHGFTRDATKLLMAKDPKSSLSAEKVPMVDLSASYYPRILAPVEG